MAASPKVQAIHAMFEALAAAPNRLDPEAFTDYQTQVMEPLREAVRQAAAAEAKEANS
jgi:hypothetical protein